MSPILALGTADWNQGIATNQHYMVRALAEEFDVVFTESMGLRRPTLSARDLSRILRRLRQALPLGQVSTSVGRAIPSRVDIRSPVMIPRHTGLAASINRRLLRWLVRDWLASPRPRVLWTYSPVTYGLEEAADLVVYHCVDLLGQVDGIRDFVIDEAERSLAPSTTAAVGSSPAVVEHLHSQGFDEVLFWPNVADVEVFTDAVLFDASREVRRVVFAGNLTPFKVDFALLRAILDAGLELHLAGPTSEGGGDGSRQVADLVAAGAVHYGLLDLPALAELLATATVGLVPYLANSYTRGVSPLKIYEYLAAGVGVVSSGVPSVEAVSGHVVTVADSAEFVQAVTELAQSWSPEAARERVAFAHSHSWTYRGEQARAVVRSVLRE